MEELGLGSDLSISSLARAAVPEAGHVQRAKAELAIRDAADKAAVGLERPWRDSIRDASNPAGDDIIDAFDHAIRQTSLGVARPAAWWRVAQVVQILLFIAMIAGFGWLAAQGVSELASFELPDLGEAAGFPVAAVVAGGSLLAGLAISVLSRIAARITGRRKARHADRELRDAIDGVTAERVIAPIQVELDSYASYRAGILTALA